MWSVELSGFRREDGKVGIRNLLVVEAAADNVNPLARELARSVPGVICLPASYGRGQLGEDLLISTRTMANLASHPNVAKALIVSFEPESGERIAATVSENGRHHVQVLSLLQERGFTNCVERGANLLREMRAATLEFKREPIKIEGITIGVECGGSDTTSGLVGNPALGLFVDSLMKAGGTAIFSEPMECVGCEEFLRKRAINDRVERQLLSSISYYKGIAHSQGIDLTGINPTPDNIIGGLTTIEEKSLGAVAKAGSARIQGVLRYGERASGPGLWFMDAPAAAVENLTALAAGGCQVMLFVTGSGNPVGHPISPTIKICANPQTVVQMNEHIDVDLSEGLQGKLTLNEGSERIASLCFTVINGTEVAAEKLGYQESNISRFGESV